MQCYDERVDVRRETGSERAGPTGEVAAAPTEFLWRGRLWQVRAVISHRAERGPRERWWATPQVRTVVAADGPSGPTIHDSGACAGSYAERPGAVATLDSPPVEREVWRVEAHCPPRPARPRLASGETRSAIFDLVFSAATGCWRLTGRVDR